MIAINEYILNRNSKIIKDKDIFNKMNIDMEFYEIKDIFEKSSYELLVNTEHKNERENENRFRYINRTYIFDAFNKKDKQYLIGFTDTCDFIFAMNPQYDKDHFLIFYYVRPENHAFQYSDPKQKTDRYLSLEEAIEYLLY